MQVIAPALRAHVPSGCDQLSCLTLLTAEQLDAATSASMKFLRENLRKAHQQLCDINQAQDSMKEELNKEPGKYQIRKMEVGLTEDFHAGLTDRIGNCAVRAACPLRSRFLTSHCGRISQSGFRKGYAGRALQHAWSRLPTLLEQLQDLVDSFS